MHLTIRNKLRLEGAPENLKNNIVSELKFPNPKYLTAIENGLNAYNIPTHIYNFEVLPDGSLALPRGYRSRLSELLSMYDENCTITDDRAIFEPNYKMNSSKIVYRPYQSKAIRGLVTNGEEGILKAPAGSGKTVMGLSLIPMFGQPTLWLTHTDRLLKQVIERAEQFLPDINKKDIGIIKGNKWTIGDILTIGMVQTLSRNPDKAFKISEKFGLVILDEAHHCPASTFNKVISIFNPFYLYGLTATPYRGDRLEDMMFQTIGPIVSSIEMDDVVNTGGIIRPIVQYVTVRSQSIDHNNVNKIIRDNIIYNKDRNKLITDHVVEEAVGGNYCIIISDRKDHCEELYKLIKKRWDKVGIATGKYSKKAIDAQVENFYNGNITVLVATFALLGEGFDVPFINRAFIACPFRSKGKAEQLIGRIQRTANGKVDALVYDYVDVDIGVLAHQFYARSATKECRFNTYNSLGIEVIPYNN